MIRVICLMLVLVCFGLPGSNFVAPACSGNPVNESTVTQRRGMSQLAVALAEHVVELVKKESNSGDDSLTEEARKLLQPEIQRQLKKDLSKKIGTGFSRERRFKDLLAEVDATLTPAKQEELREELRSGSPKIQGWPWPLCVISGCK